MHYNFIEIGTANFDTLIQRCSDEDIGLSIEPLPHLLNQLPNKKNVVKINCAISSEEKDIKIYYVEQEKISSYNLPWWFIGSSSVNKIHDGILRVLGERNLDINDIVIEQAIKAKKIGNIIKEYNITSLDLLKIDTEGHDAVILNNFFDDYESSLITFLPTIIAFEHNGLYPENDYTVIINRAKKLNYSIKEQVADTILYRET